MSDCIEWPGTRTKAGYPQRYIPVAERSPGAHRQVYEHRRVLEEKLGRPLKPGHFACHTCDNPPCVNADHLFEGTQTDNMRDAVRKGRHSGGRWLGGELHTQAKLTDAQVVEMRFRWALGEFHTQRALAREYGVSEGAVSMILSGKRRARAASRNLLA